MTAKPDQPEQRDRTLARLLAGAHKPSATSGGAADGVACPDAELLAAYAEQGLADDERVRLESHFADCGRCQEILVLMAVSAHEPLTEQETRRLGQLVATPSAPASPTASKPQMRPSPAPQRWLWWLAPAFGAVAAATLWLVLRPVAPGGSPVTQTAADYSAANKSAELEPRSEIAQANVPPPPVAAPAPKVLDRARENVPASPGARADELQTDELKKTARNEESTRDAQSAIALSAAPAARAKQEQQPKESVAELKANDAPSASGATAAATAAPTPATPAASAAAEGKLAEQARDLGSSGNASILMRARPETVFSSPDGTVRWRTYSRVIERSTDGERTWQEQASGVTTNLEAGAAASNQVAWVVGRAGVILRTVDGAQWQRISAPPGATLDWVAVQARDALRATITSADGRRFSTEDAGRTWTQQ